jgi:hypothetical protein
VIDCFDGMGVSLSMGTRIDAKLVNQCSTRPSRPLPQTASGPWCIRIVEVTPAAWLPIPDRRRMAGRPLSEQHGRQRMLHARFLRTLKERAVLLARLVALPMDRFVAAVDSKSLVQRDANQDLTGIP